MVEPESRWRDLPKRLKRRIVVGGGIFGLAPWMILSYMKGSEVIGLILGYVLLTLLIPFFVSLSHPLGNRGGARVGMYVVLAGWAWSVIYMVGMSLYKLTFFYGRPTFALILTTLLLPVLILVARLAGAVGGYLPEEPPEEAANGA